MDSTDYLESIILPLHFITLLFAILLVSSNANAAFFSSVKKYSIEDGLPATTIYSIARDHRGYFWLGTPSGLVRFDGYEFNVYSPADEQNKTIAFANAGNIFIDSKHRIWIGSWGDGAAVYDENLNLIKWFQPDTQSSSSLQSGLVQTFFEDNTGTVWVGTNGGGLAKFREETQDFVNFMHKPNDNNSISHNRIWGIAQSSDGAMWIATSDGLNKLTDEANVARYQHEESTSSSLDHPLIRDVYVDANDNVWVGTELSFGLFIEQRVSYIPKVPTTSMANSAVTRIRRADESNLWVGTQRGLYRFDIANDTYTPLINEQKLALLPNDDIRDIYVSPDNDLWVATRYAGLSQITLEPSSFSGYTQFTDLKGRQTNIHTIYAIAEDKSRNIWLGAAQGLIRWTPTGLYQYQASGLPDHLEIFSIAVDASNNLWLGTENGVGTLNLDTNTFTFRDQIIGDTERMAVTHIAIDSVGTVWLATNHWGLIKARGDKSERFQHAQDDPRSISGDNISHVFEDNKGRMWIAVAGTGINRLDPERNRFFRYQGNDKGERSSALQNLYQIFQSQSGDLWFGGSRALLRLNEITDSYENIIESAVLPNINIKSLIDDEFGDLWLGTEFGIAHYRVAQNYFASYTIDDGLHGNQFFQRAALRTSQQGLFFGGIGGLTVVNKIPQPTQNYHDSPVISAVLVDGKPIPELAFDTNHPVELPHNVKNIEIKFTALNFDPQNTRYRYRLENFDNSWSKPTDGNNIVYSGLDSGEYVFQVNATRNNNIWSTHPAKLNIIIATPWWENNKLRFLIATILVIAGIIFYQTRTRSLRQQKIALESEIAERSKELIQAQKQLIESEKQTSISGLVAGVAHEINTPIGISITAASNLKERSQTILTNLQENKLKKTELTETVNNILNSAEMVLGNLTKASELIRSFKEVSVDQISQQKRQFDMRLYLAEVVASLMPKLRAAGITLTSDCPDNLKITSYPGAIAQMITQLTLNSIIHGFDGEPNGQIEISIKCPDDIMYIEFKDNGKGIPPESLGRIFEPFYTTKRSSGANGLGLQIVSNIVTVRLGGNIRCESEVGKGTCFYMDFKVLR